MGKSYAHIEAFRAALAEKGWWHSFALPDGTRIDGVNPVESQQWRLAQFPLPIDLSGHRVLDIGTWDGWFAFETERRGAEVLAIDDWDNPRFHDMRRRLKSRVQFRQMDFYELTPAAVGQFSIVLFLGVLYHLRHPLLALERVCSLTRDLALVDSFIMRERHNPDDDSSARPLMEFYETGECGGQTDNWVAPNLSCLMAFCRSAGFARVELRACQEYGASVACYRNWLAACDSREEPPVLAAVTHNRNGGINFRSNHDEFVTVWMKGDCTGLGLDDVQPEVGGFGARPFTVTATRDDGWLANFKLPPGLAPGWHEVTVRVKNGPRSNSHKIAVDLPMRAAARPRIVGIRDGVTWEVNRLDLSRGTTLCIWVSGLAENADRNNVALVIGERPLAPSYLGDGEGTRQLNVQVPEQIGTGEIAVRVLLGEHTSEAVAVNFQRG